MIPISVACFTGPLIIVHTLYNNKFLCNNIFYILSIKKGRLFDTLGRRLMQGLTCIF